jgi:hypothetical protein
MTLLRQEERTFDFVALHSPMLAHPGPPARQGHVRSWWKLTCGGGHAW